MAACLKGIVELLAGDLDDFEMVLEGEEGDDVSVGEVTAGKFNTYAASVAEGYLGVADGTEGVADEVACVGLTESYGLAACIIEYTYGEVAVADYLRGLACDESLDAVYDGGSVRVS